MIRIVVAFLLCLHLVLPFAVWAQERAKSPLDYSIKQYAVMLGMALLGGLVAWYSKVRAGVLPAWSINHLVGELCTSAFAGLLCFYVCEWSGFPQLLTVALTGIVGHMGTRGIAMFEEWASKRFPTSGK